jgi:hypothetical protein
MAIEKTKTGTFISDGIEYNETPVPKMLVKAMSKEWADPLVYKGKLRIHHLNYFRNWENKVLGDPNDGNGQYHLNGQPMETGSTNDVYALCMSFPKVSHSRLNIFAEQSGYNCLVFIHDPEVLFQRIKKWLVANYHGFKVHCGAVKYNRGSEVDKKTLNKQQFHYNVFQKAPSFKEDQEYRLSVTNCTFVPLKNKYIDLVIGNCNDIASIEELPNKSFEVTPKAEPF